MMHQSVRYYAKKKNAGRSGQFCSQDAVTKKKCQNTLTF